MKTIIAGSRGITDYALVLSAIKESGFNITEVVSGTAKGVDRLGEIYAYKNKIPVKYFPAAWEELNVPGAFIREGRWGLYNVNAGKDRNTKMVEYADALIAITSGTYGTEDMIKKARDRGLKIYFRVVQ